MWVEIREICESKVEEKWKISAVSSLWLGASVSSRLVHLCGLCVGVVVFAFCFQPNSSRLSLSAVSAPVCSSQDKHRNCFDFSAVCAAKARRWYHSGRRRSVQLAEKGRSRNRFLWTERELPHHLHDVTSDAHNKHLHYRERPSCSPRKSASRKAKQSLLFTLKTFE